MPSLFPGMDPFLEHPLHFPGLHDRLITSISDDLQSRLPPPYYAEIGERLWVEVTERLIEPDVHVVRPDPSTVGSKEGNGGVAVAPAIRNQPVVVTVPHDERRETFVAIVTRSADAERVVTAIEVLSLSHKTPGEHGRELYLRKQREVLASQTHLVEIDLLRAGLHTTAVNHSWMTAKVKPCDYHVSVHRFDRLEDFFVYPILLTEPLPEIAVPLLPGDCEIPLDLQAVFDRCYDHGPYRRKVRYRTEAIVPPLTGAQLTWAASLLGAAPTEFA